MKTLTRKNFVFAAIQFFVLCLFAYMLPVTQDEAYYYAWSNALSLGYFDHPPMISWMIWVGRHLGWLLPLEISIRLIPAIFSVGLGLLVAGHGNHWLSNRHGFFAQVALSSSFAGLLMGVLSTPDIPVAFFWGLALHFSCTAILKDRPKNWLAAGIMTGLGILGKYTVMLLGPVFLLSLLLKKRSQLFSPWPYLGGLLCLLVITPNLIWNAQNDWQTFRFQLGHGIGAEKEQLSHTHLPTAIPRRISPDSKSFAVPYFQSNIEQGEQKKKPKRKKTFWEKANRNFGDFLGAQIGMWGLAGLFLVLLCLARICRRVLLKINVLPQIDPETSARDLASIAALVPLFLFAMWSFFAKVEGNWASMYMITGVFFVATIFVRFPKTFFALGFLNTMVFFYVVLFAGYPKTLAELHLAPSKGLHKNRLLQETHGYEKLAETIMKFHSTSPIFADSYQIVSMLRYYRDSFGIASEASGISIDQWPGITRPSHYLLSKKIQEHSYAKPLTSFTLITTDQIPPLIKGFEADNATRLNDCLARQTVDITNSPATFLQDCDGLVHRWNIYRYVKNGH